MLNEHTKAIDALVAELELNTDTVSTACWSLAMATPIVVICLAVALSNIG